MIGLVAAAWAEPLAARVPADGVVVVAGLPEVGAGVWIDDHLGVTAGADVKGGAADVAGAWRTELARADGGFGVDAGAAVGVVVAFAAARPGIEAAPWIGVGWRRPGWSAGIDLAVPAVVAVGEGSPVRVPVLLEPWVGVTIRRVTVAAGAGLGEVFVPGELPAVALRWQVGVGWAFAGADRGR